MQHDLNILKNNTKLQGNKKCVDCKHSFVHLQKHSFMEREVVPEKCLFGAFPQGA